MRVPRNLATLEVLRQTPALSEVRAPNGQHNVVRARVTTMLEATRGSDALTLVDKYS